MGRGAVRAIPFVLSGIIPQSPAAEGLGPAGAREYCLSGTKFKFVKFPNVFGWSELAIAFKLNLEQQMNCHNSSHCWL